MRSFKLSSHEWNSETSSDLIVEAGNMNIYTDSFYVLRGPGGVYSVYPSFSVYPLYILLYRELLPSCLATSGEVNEFLWIESENKREKSEVRRRGLFRYLFHSQKNHYTVRKFWHRISRRMFCRGLRNQGAGEWIG